MTFLKIVPYLFILQSLLYLSIDPNVHVCRRSRLLHLHQLAYTRVLTPDLYTAGLLEMPSTVEDGSKRIRKKTERLETSYESPSKVVEVLLPGNGLFYTFYSTRAGITHIYAGRLHCRISFCTQSIYWYQVLMISLL